jgi:LacI family transcriptional regulator, galactose operon repressor
LDRLLNENRVDGIIIMVDEMSGGVLERLKNASIPLVILDKNVEHRHLDNVLVDNRTGARDATEHLIKVHGITNLLFVGGPTDNVDSRDRADGFGDALREAGIEFKSDMLFNTDYQFESGFALSRKLLPRLKSRDHWGIVAANDNLAQGLISGFLREGIQVPENVAVIGHDDSELAILSRPRLTTVRVPLREIGQSAVKTILEQLADPTRDTTKVILRGKLIVRESCGCVENIEPEKKEF